MVVVSSFFERHLVGKYLRLEDGLSSVHEGGDDGGGVDSHVPWAELKRCEAAFL